MLTLIKRWLNARRRQIDVDFLWPACKRHASCLDHARAAFAAHAFHDRAWREFSPAQIDEFVRQLS